MTARTGAPPAAPPTAFGVGVAVQAVNAAAMDDAAEAYSLEVFVKAVNAPGARLLRDSVGVAGAARRRAQPSVRVLCKGSLCFNGAAQ